MSLLKQLLKPDAIKARNIKEISYPWYLVLNILFAIALFLVINQIFSLRLFGFLPIGTAYTYYLIGIFSAAVFIVYPANKNYLHKIPFFDIILFLLSIIVNVYFALHAIEIIQYGWEMIAPPMATAFSFILWFLVVEAVRRTSGPVLAVVSTFFSFYPLFADRLPGLIGGISFTLPEIARNHAMSSEAILGVPITSLGTLLVGFLLFGVVLSYTGGGPFFLNVAQALLGHKPGGPAKVAVLSSALFGSISGSAVANVVTTGSITIPLMKKTGISAEYAGAVEACASTGGVIAPPIMGAAAFIMASFLGVSYAEVVTAAIIPSALFYIGLFFQIDLYSMKSGLKGLPKDQLPSFTETLKEGWYYLLGILVLIYYLFIVRVDAWAPFYASLSLIILSMISKTSRLDMKKFIGLIYEFGLVVGRIVALLASVGLIIGALSRTGVALSFSRELVVATDSVITLLLTGAFASFILGMGMVSVAVYIFLAIVMVPALTAFGINPIAAHFFVLYWGVVSFITPPVALASYTAAGIADSDPIKTGLLGMRLGTMYYVLPFLFVYNPLLLAQGPILQVLGTFVFALVGVYLIAAGYEGYLKKVGLLPKLSRIVYIVAGLMLAWPELITSLIGIAAAVITILLTIRYNSRKLNNAIASAE